MANQRVTLEEIRARRLDKEAKSGKVADKQALIPIPPDESRIEPLQTQYPGSAADDQTATEAAPEPVPAPAPSPVPAVANLEDFLSSATPEQLQKLRVLAAADGMVVAPLSLGGSKNTDGSLIVSVFLDPQVTEQLEIWAEADGCTLVEEAQKRINESLTNYLYGDWNPIVEQPPVEAVVVPAASVAATK